jgi:hypothetical protein
MGFWFWSGQYLLRLRIWFFFWSNYGLYPFNHLNTGQEIHAEIDKLPDDTLSGIFFLLKNEHVMVEELLQLFVGEVNANLLETVVLSNDIYKY